MAPPHAILIWADAVNIYCAPQGSPEVAVAFRLSTGGLAQAIALLGAEHIEKAKGQPYLRPEIASRSLLKNNLTVADLRSAREALRELGIIK